MKFMLNPLNQEKQCYLLKKVMMKKSKISFNIMKNISDAEDQD